MDLITLKYWHWAVLGVIAGSTIGFAWTQMPTDLPRNADPIDLQYCVDAKGETEAARDRPAFRNIVVHAPETDPNGSLVYPITYDRLGTENEKVVYLAEGVYAPTPFVNGQSVIEFLESKNVSFSNRAGAAKYTPVGSGAAIGLVSVGLIWPTLIRLLVGAGLAKPKPVEEKRRYASGPQNDGSIKSKKAAVTAGDMRTLNALNDELEKSVGKGLAAGAPRGATATADEPVSVLMSGTGARSAADPTAAPVPRTPEEEKEYAGQWYPVAKPTHKKDEEPKK